MLKKNHSNFIGNLILTLFIVMFQQSQTSNINAQDANSDLAFSVSTRQSQYVLREPIPFGLKLSNQTNSPQKSGSSLKLVNTKMTVSTADGKVSQWDMKNFYLDGSPVGGVDVLPGQQMISEDLIDGSIAEDIFSSPGKYDVKFEYFYDIYIPQREQIKFTSNSVTITIIRPDGVNKNAYEFLKGPYEAARRKSDMSTLKQKMQSFVDSFGSSVYAKYMIVELAGFYQGSEDAKALKELCKIHNLDFFYSKNINSELLTINARVHPMIMNPNLSEFEPTPVVIHPCTGKPIIPLEL